MPVYEDETLHGALKKAIRAGSLAGLSENRKPSTEMVRRAECQGLRRRIFAEDGELIILESEISLKMNDLRQVLRQVEAGADTAITGTIAALANLVFRLGAARQALQRFGRADRPSRNDLDQAVERADIARDLGSVPGGLTKIARGQPRVQRLNNDLEKLQARAKAHNTKFDALRRAYWKLECQEVFPL